MSPNGIRAHRVSKKFRRGEIHDSLRDLLPAVARTVFRRPQAAGHSRGEFWAVRDLTFEVGPGEALGIIGPNGAGKSTVLKLLTKIIRPSQGYCHVHGRVGALIEIAAGFHPDLTGRENVFLQGAIMGMRRAEITRRFDEIVDFSGISEFIDTPVKRYSSGMNARLGFSIAAHLEPDVLIIDEVLAVGDFAFQDRAFGRIRSIVGQGIPVVVVSHQLERIASLCTRAILLNRGAMVKEGNPTECIAAYVSGQAQAETSPAEPAPVHIRTLSLCSPDTVRSGDPVQFRIHGSINGSYSRELEVIEIRVRALQTGQLIFVTSTDRCNVPLPESGEFVLDNELQMNVPVGAYSIETVVYHRRRQCVIGQGPFATVNVQGGPTFWGTVQLNARMVEGTGPGTHAVLGSAALSPLPPRADRGAR